MGPREPAGWERGKGKSAESVIRARMVGGSAGNTRGTVCGRPRVRYPLTELDAKGVHRLSVGACLYRLYFLSGNLFVRRCRNGSFSAMRRQRFLT